MTLLDLDFLCGCEEPLVLLEPVVDAVLGNEVILHGQNEPLVVHELLIGRARYSNCGLFVGVVAVP